jgi:uncharacterized SAM-binding protein YcdF (DUF218 family)
MDNIEHPVLPWWRVRMVWLVIAGPLLVVLAGVVTTVVAVRGADPVVRAQAAAPSLAPAIQARNHAAAPRR